MESPDLSPRLLDTAIKAMERNRTLLFAINLIAALILVVVYLEKFSFDLKQKEGYLISYQGRCAALNGVLKDIPEYEKVPENDKKVLRECTDLDKITGFVASTNANENQTRAASAQLFRLYVIQNEMNASRLDTASVSPLGFGIQVPRNDIVLICGILLVIFYTWLFFSFKQLALIMKKIKKLYPEKKTKDPDKIQATVNDLIDVNFLFRTSEGGFSAIMVKGLYWLAPISMTVAMVNNLFLTGGAQSYVDYLNSFLQVPLMLQAMITIVLWIIGYNVNSSDKGSVIDKGEN